MNFGKPRTLKDIFSKEIILLYGAGAQSKGCIELLGKEREIHLFDSDSRKWNQSVHSTLVHPAHELAEYYKVGRTAVVISSIYNQYEIAVDLKENYSVSEDDLFGFTNDFYEKNVYVEAFSELEKEGIKISLEHMADQASKDYYASSLEFRITRNPLLLAPNTTMIRTGEYADIVTVRKDDVLVDCGAYTGDTAEMYYTYSGNACKVIAVEPFQESYELLKERAKVLGAKDNIRCYQYAISDTKRTESFCYNDDDLKMGINIEKQQGEKKQFIEVINLDLLLENEEKIDFIKMDIEGEEMNAIEGGKTVIGKFKPRMMVSAYHHHTHMCLVIPQLLKINSSYRFYAGHTPGVSLESEFYII